MPKRKSRKKKRSTEPVRAVLEEESDVSDLEMDDDSGSLLEEGRADFLKKLTFDNLEPKQKSRKSQQDESTRLQLKRKRELSDTEEDSEAEFESHPRPSRWGDKEENKLHYLLPLKAERGQLILQQPTLLQQPIASDSDTEEKGDANNEEIGQSSVSGNEREGEVNADEDAPPPVLTTAALFVKRQEKLSQKKEKIAELASLLIENPEENIDHLKQLRSLCSERDPDVAISVRKLAMVSLMAVIKDIAPSYRIRELSQSEKSVKVTKEVRRLRNFEQTLLQNYQLFLTLLDETVRVGLGEEGESGSNEGRRKRRRERKKPLEMLDDDQMLTKESMKSVGEVALQCLCELVVSLPHFNYRNNILVVLVPRMNSRALDGKVSQMCCDTIEKLFRNDVVGEVSLETVQLISKLVKAKSYKTKTIVLRTFLHLQLHNVDEPVSGQPPTGMKGKTKEERKREMKQRMAKMTKKQRRRMKAEARLNHDMRETEAVESRERKNQLQTEIVKSVFLTYFRILKHSRHSPLLQPVLEGLAKFAHLINVDFFSDLMSILHSLAETGGLSNRECMQCVLTAFEILSGQGEVLNIDPRQFYTQLYGAILQLDACTSRQDVLLAVNCLDKMMRKRRQVSLQRVLGFVKRLATISLQLLPGACLAVMATIKKFIQLYSQCEQLLDVDSVVGSGVFRPDVPDPEMCHASSTSLWELTLFKNHYDPTLRRYATHLLAGAPSQGKGSLSSDLARKTPDELLDDFSVFNICTTRDPVLGVPSCPPNKATRKKKRELFRDCGIQSEDLRKREAAAFQHADSVLQNLISVHAADYQVDNGSS